jgi:hypothetical protein
VLIQAVFNDITQRKQVEADLLRTLARERELGQLKSSFVSTVSHEFGLRSASSNPRRRFCVTTSRG